MLYCVLVRAWLIFLDVAYVSEKIIGMSAGLDWLGGRAGSRSLSRMNLRAAAGPGGGITLPPTGSACPLSLGGGGGGTLFSAIFFSSFTHFTFRSRMQTRS